jgi:hypothetical protein
MEASEEGLIVRFDPERGMELVSVEAAVEMDSLSPSFAGEVRPLLVVLPWRLVYFIWYELPTIDTRTYS